MQLAAYATAMPADAAAAISESSLTSLSTLTLVFYELIIINYTPYILLHNVIMMTSMYINYIDGIQNFYPPPFETLVATNEI